MQDAASSGGVSTMDAAVLAVTLRVLVLASSAGQPQAALPLRSALHLLPSINSAITKAANDEIGALAACMAEILAYQHLTGCLVCSLLHRSQCLNTLVPFGASSVL